ncbi:MAG: gamma-glutamyltransferase [Nocardioidaceae bacterium]
MRKSHLTSHARGTTTNVWRQWRLRRGVAAAVVGLLATSLPFLGSGGSASGSTGQVAREGSRAAAALALPAGTDRQAVARGRGGAVSSVDPNASRIGVRVLRQGGNAVDAAVATAAALGVTEPFSSGIGGGGYFVFYQARSGRITTLDGRETAPAGIRRDAFIDPSTGEPYLFFPDLVTSGVSVGVPGTLATWKKALNNWGTTSLRQALRPSELLARDGFRVDETFNRQVDENAERFSAFPSTTKLYLPGGDPPAIGSRFRNPDLARTYHLIGERGTRFFYNGPLAAEIAQTVQSPPARKNTDLPIPPGSMTRRDLAKYNVITRRPTHVRYRNIDVFGMAPSSSGGTTVGETLNILDNFRLSPERRVRSLHLYLEASARAFADRAAYVGDPAFVDVPTKRLTSKPFAYTRACTIDPRHAATKPVPPGPLYGAGCRPSSADETKPDTEGLSTTHVSVVDRWGNAVSYTLTIEQTGGSGIVVPQRGFLLNNELTDFTTEYVQSDPNRIQPGKRPRSSMSPTIVLRNGRLAFVLGSPGGSTIITTVVQILINRIDFDLTLLQAVAAPRAAQRNTPDVTAEQAFIDRYGSRLEQYGHTFVVPGEPGTSAAEIGAAAAIEVRPGGLLIAVAEPTRRGGGDAEVVCPGWVSQCR